MILFLTYGIIKCTLKILYIKGGFSNENFQNFISNIIGSSYTKNDATVAYGYKDFVFTNSYDFPIKIEAYSYKAVISIKLYKEPITEN